MTSERVLAEIRAEMGRQQIRQGELADRIGRSQVWVSRRLSGAREMSLTDLDEIAEALDVPAEQLLTGIPAARRSADESV